MAQTNVKLANINKLPPNAPKLNGVIRCTLPACKKKGSDMSVSLRMYFGDEQQETLTKKALP